VRRGAATGVAVRTPLIPFVGAPGNLLIKPESLQQTSAFKLCSAYNAISALLETEGPAAAKANGVVAPSSGNHGFAVAYAAALLKVKAAIVVPGNGPGGQDRRNRQNWRRAHPGRAHGRRGRHRGRGTARPLGAGVRHRLTHKRGNDSQSTAGPIRSAAT
jgi:hypothetical protein